MFWRVAGFNQPSPIEQILDKEEYTLEELLDEDDIIQECKSLNGRLVSFLREKSTVEQLLRYLVEPQLDTEDPKKQYKYPFTACEVFCCEVEAIFNTLLSQPELMQLLFSLLDQPPPLSCKAAGYFGRVVQHLLLRKTNETMSYLQENKEVLESLINHIDTTSIADIFKRLMGADEQTSAAMMPNHLSWLAETQLIELLLQRFGPEYSPEVQQNAADILTSVAHTQPSPIALKLTKDQSIAYLFQHALAPGGRVLVSALDVCIALLEPRRHTALMPMQGEPGYDTGVLPSKKDAVQATLKYIEPLVSLLDAANPEATQETPFGMLRPPLGTARLKIVELLAVLLRAGEELAERAVMDAGAVPKCLDLFVAYPFNNLLHYHITAMLVTGVTSKNSSIIEYLFGTCKVAEWLVDVPEQTTPLPRPGMEAAAANRPPLRAGYMGHISCLAQVFHNKVDGEDRDPTVASFLENNEAWQRFWDERLAPHLAIENVKNWECGRPAAGNVDMDHSDTEEYQNDMDPELMQGMQSSLYHRYSVGGADDEDEDDDVEMRMDSLDALDLLPASGAGGADAGASSSQGAGLPGGDGEEHKQAIEDVLSGLNISEGGAEEGAGAAQGARAAGGEQQGELKHFWFGASAAGDSAASRSLPETTGTTTTPTHPPLPPSTAPPALPTESHVVDMPLEQDDDDQVLYDEDELAAAPPASAATPASEPEPSAPVTAPLANGTDQPPTESPVKAFPLDQLPTGAQDDAAATSPTGAAAAASDSSGPPAAGAKLAGGLAVAGAAGAAAAGAGEGGSPQQSNGKVPGGGKGGEEEVAFNDNMYWKSSYKIEVPDDI